VAVSAAPEAAGGVPPQNLEAEASVLGSILLTEQALDGVLIEVGLTPADFYRPRHQVLFRSMIRLKEKPDPEPIDAVTVCEDLRRAGELEEAGGEGYVHSLPALVIAAGNVLHYARIVKENAQLRRILSVTRELQEEVMAHRGDPGELIERFEANLFRIGHDNGVGEVRSVEGVLHDELDRLERLSREGPDLTGTTSGFIDIDEVTGGFQPGNLIVLAARPAMGKSALVTNIAEHAAIDAGKPVVIFSLEMSETELAHRFLASQARISSDELRKGRVKGTRWNKVLRAAEKLTSAPLYVDDSSDIGVLEVRAKARRLNARHRLGLIIVDYLQLMRPDGKTENRVEQVGQISRGLKVLARELEVPVVAVSQLSRAVETQQGGDKKPMLSHLRESGCLAGDSRIYLPDIGEYRPIADLAGGTDFRILALNRETLRLEPRSVTNAFSTGCQPVFRLSTRLGRTIRATANHRFLTFEGWRRLDELGAEAHVALPRVLSGPDVASMTDDELALVGHLIGDGCTLPRHVVQYTTSDPALAQLVVTLARRVFGPAIQPRVKQERRWHQVYLSASGRLTHRRRNPVAAWLSRLGAFGYRSHEKRVPAAVFKQPPAGIARFLRHLWATDGSIQLGRGSKVRPVAYYATSSSRLAQEVQSLLLRLGVNARRREVPQRGNGRLQYHVDVTGADDVIRFLTVVGGLGESRHRTQERILQELARSRPNTNRDVIPRAAWRDLVVPAMASGPITTREMQGALGQAYCGSTLYTRNLSRERASRVAEVVGCDALRRLATSDIYWDRIVSVEPDGVEEVFDLTVDGLHNFIAEDIVVHNSIEQDADLVMFIYREEYYAKKESERPNEADIIIAKHRNGPTRDVTLTFQSRYPKFSNFSPDDAGLGAGT
jgi:replicative DNA helicase